MQWPSSRAFVEHLDPIGGRQLHPQLLASDPLHPRWHRPSRLLYLQLAVLDIVSARLRDFALQVDKELARLMARGDQRERACDQHREQDEVYSHHHASGPSVRSATRSVALRARGFAVSSAVPARIARPTTRRGGAGSAAAMIGNRAVRGSPPNGRLCWRMNCFTMRSSSE